MVQESDSDECEALYESNSDECETNYNPTVHVHPPPLPDTQHLFEGSTLTVKTSSVLIQQYKMRHGLTLTTSNHTHAVLSCFMQHVTCQRKQWCLILYSLMDFTAVAGVCKKVYYI